MLECWCSEVKRGFDCEIDAWLSGCWQVKRGLRLTERISISCPSPLTLTLSTVSAKLRLIHYSGYLSLKPLTLRLCSTQSLLLSNIKCLSENRIHQHFDFIVYTDRFIKNRRLLVTPTTMSFPKQCVCSTQPIHLGLAEERIRKGTEGNLVQPKILEKYFHTVTLILSLELWQVDTVWTFFSCFTETQIQNVVTLRPPALNRYSDNGNMETYRFGNMATWQHMAMIT